MIFRVILIVCTLTIYLPTMAQIIPYRYYNTTNGLIQSQVTAITQDNNGFIWIGTLGGINKFDGKNFSRFTERDGLVEDWVTALATDNLGNVWIGHWGGGITVYDTKLNYLKEIKLDKTMRGNAVVKIVKGNANDVWVINSSEKIYHYKTTEIAPEVIEISNELPKTTITDISINTKLLAVSTNKGIIVLNNVNGKILKTKINPLIDNEFVIDLCLKEQNLLCFTKSKKIYSISKITENSTAEELTVPLTSNVKIEDIKQLIKLSNNEIWATTKNSGAYKFTVNNKTLLAEKHDFAHGLSYNETNTIFSDAENTVWIGTNAGLNQYLGSGFTTINKWSGLEDNMIEDVCINNQRLYAATSKGLSIIDKNNLSVLKNLPLAKLNSLTLINNKLFTSSTNSIYEINDAVIKKIIDISGKINGIKSFNNHLFIASDKGLIRSNFTKTETIIEGDFYRITNGIKGVYGINTNGEIYYTNGEESKKISYPEIESELVLAMKEDNNQNLWISTYHSGIFKIEKNGKIFNYLLSDDNFNYVPFSLTLSQNYLWAGTNRGVVRLNLTNKQFVVFDSNEGFEGIEANANAVCIDSNKIYFGTIMGVCAFNTDLTKKLTQLPRPFIKKAVSFPDNFLIKDYDRIKANNNSINIEFSAISTTWANKASFSYRLLGQDSNWINTSSEEVWFRKLKPGTYIFELKTKVANESNPKQTARLTFYIKPPFYKTPWFLGTCLLLMGGILYLVVRNRARNLYLDKIDLEGQILELQKTIEEKEAEIKKLKGKQ